MCPQKLFLVTTRLNSVRLECKIKPALEPNSWCWSYCPNDSQQPWLDFAQQASTSLETKESPTVIVNILSYFPPSPLLEKNRKLSSLQDRVSSANKCLATQWWDLQPIPDSDVKIEELLFYRKGGLNFLDTIIHLESTLSIFLTSLRRGDWLRTNLAICYKGITI